jgi:hypothetical protein
VSMRSNICPLRSCSSCAENFSDLEYAIEHVRKQHNNDIRRPGAIGCTDSHGHLWYCFGCETALKDHKSFDSDEAMMAHLTACHEKCITHIDNLSHSMDIGYCFSCYG